MPNDPSATPLHPYLAEVLGDDWLWRSMGGEVLLVTEHGGARVVIAPNPNRKSGMPCIMVPTEREGGGHSLAPITPEHPIAKLLAAVPDLVRLAQSVRAATHDAGDAGAVLRKAGLA